tara:strand:+ start:79 stop:348 length:270 start_codon:yes stop_codon:yes gene_type:complete
MRSKEKSSEEVSLFLMAREDTPDTLPHRAILFRDGGCIILDLGFILYYPTIEMAKFFTGFDPCVYDMATTSEMGGATGWSLSSTDYGPM